MVGAEAKWLKLLELQHESGQWHKTVLEVIIFFITMHLQKTGYPYIESLFNNGTGIIR